jgi:uncharacterized protein (UPF0332 family)
MLSRPIAFLTFDLKTQNKMALSADFLRQARELATRRGRPSQINLRRSTSAAYYALFHLLIGEVVERMVPATPPSLRARVSRSLQHGELKEACIDFRKPSPPQKLRPLLGAPISVDLCAFAEIFVDLQDQRHVADYDTDLKLSLPAVMSSVVKAEAAFSHWRAIRSTTEANVFLAALVFGKRWNR